jgi:hypothetical protein
VTILSCVGAARHPVGSGLFCRADIAALAARAARWSPRQRFDRRRASRRRVLAPPRLRGLVYGSGFEAIRLLAGATAGARSAIPAVVAAVRVGALSVCSTAWASAAVRGYFHHPTGCWCSILGLVDPGAAGIAGRRRAYFSGFSRPHAVSAFGDGRCARVLGGNEQRFAARPGLPFLWCRRRRRPTPTVASRSCQADA